MNVSLWLCLFSIVYFSVAAIFTGLGEVAWVGILTSLTLFVFSYHLTLVKVDKVSKKDDSLQQEIDGIKAELDRLSSLISTVKSAQALKSLGGFRE